MNPSILPSILFVCLGNICRSPLAEAAFRKRAEEAGLDFQVDSAGTGGWHCGEPPDARAIVEAKQRGVDISNYRARQVKSRDFDTFTHIIALDADNLRDLKAIAPAEATAQLYLLMDFVEGWGGESVADPYYGEAADFARTWEVVDRGAVGLVQKLQRTS